MDKASKGRGQHTPGPWTADEAGFVNHAGGWGVAKAYGANPTCGANARLISAAPELADSLEALLGTCEMNMDDMEPATLATIKSARRALAKARGEA